MKCKNILEAIGKTPLVRLNRITAGLAPEVYAKVDYLNPGGSVKDRIGTTMIDDAERRGLLETRRHNTHRSKALPEIPEWVWRSLPPFADTKWFSPLPISSPRKKWIY